MSNNSSFCMWGERGLIATFFSDLHQLNDMHEIQNFLRMAGLFQEQTESHLVPEKVQFVIEPDFGNKGFGHPDAILGISYNERYVVIIVEAKRTVYEKACRPSSNRGQKGYNSTLNGQLELDFCLAMALSQYDQESSTKLIEPVWILTTRYNEDRKGNLRFVQNANVLKELAIPFSSKSLDQFYYLVITSDIENPLNTASKDLLPELFIPELKGITMNYRNVWTEYRQRFGWLNYETMLQFIQRIQGQLTTESLFIPTYEMNQGGLSQLTSCEELDDNSDDDNNGNKEGEEKQLGPPPHWGVWIVKFENKKCHLSCQRFSYALRYLERGIWNELDRGVKDEPKMRRMLSRVKVIQKGPRTTIDDIPFWEKLINDIDDC